MANPGSSDPATIDIHEVLCRTMRIPFAEAEILLRDFLAFIETTAHQELITHGTGMPLNVNFWVKEYLRVRATLPEPQPA